MIKWERSNNYMGEDYKEYYQLYKQTRDSDILEKSNFSCIAEDLKAKFGEENDQTWQIARLGHWAVGWIEIILIHESANNIVSFGEDIQRKLEDYPVYDEDHYGQIESEYGQEIWDMITLSEKIDYCNMAHISIFAARSKYYPVDCLGYLTE